MDVFNALAPVFFIIGLGAFLRNSGFMPASIVELVTRLTFWVALPALLFYESAQAKLSMLNRPGIFIVLLVGMTTGIIAGYAAARIMHLPPAQLRTMVQASFRGNIAFIGLPVVAYSIGENSREMITLSVLMVSVLLPVNNILAVLVLLRGQPRIGAGGALWAALEWLLVNPLIISCAAGLLVAATGIQLPVAMLRTLKPLGDMALPLALLSIGSMLDFREVKGLWLPILAASLIKVALSPYIGYLSAGMAGVSGDELRVTLIMLACPTATASFIMTFQMGGDTHMVTGAIVLSTLLSFISLFVIIWL